MSRSWPRLLIVVGAGGVGKTTLAAALATRSAAGGDDTLVMTFDPSHRLKDALGVADAAGDRAVPVPGGTGGRFDASLLDARRTFDRLVDRYAPDPEARRRILDNRYYRHLAGSLAGILEYMAVERLFEVWQSGSYHRIVLDTPPTRQALDFLEAPRRIVGFLDSGAVRIALKPWFAADGSLRVTRRLGPLGRRLDAFLDELVGLDLLRDMAEFFQAFGPLYDGFRSRAQEVERLLRSDDARFVLVAGPGEERIPDALFFARRLAETGHRLGPLMVNRLHPRPTRQAAVGPQRGSRGAELMAWLGERDARGVAELRSLVGGAQSLIEVPLLPRAPSEIDALAALGEMLERLWARAAAAG